MALAVDTNVLVQLGAGDAATNKAFLVIQERLADHRRFLVPTVLAELRVHALCSEIPGLRRSAAKGLDTALRDHAFSPMRLDPTRQHVVEAVSDRLLGSGLIPPAERNDARILSEAAVFGCELLVSDDSHLRSLDRDRAEKILTELDLELPAIITTREIVRMFFR